MTGRQLFTWMLAALVPGLALWFAAPPDRGEVGLAVAPFGWPSMVAVHLLAALPLAVALGNRSRGWFVSAGEGIPPWAPAIIGIIFAAIAYYQTQDIGEVLTECGFAMRAIARTLGCVLLAWPWCLIAADSPGRVWMLLFTAIAALALPAIHADALADKGIREGSDLLLQDRLVAARPQWIAVGDLAPFRLAPGFKKPTTPPEVVKLLDADIAKISKAVEGGLPAKISAKGKFDYTGALLNLDRAPEAEAILRTLPADPAVSRRLAEALSRQGKFLESDDVVRPLLDSPDAVTRRGVYEQLARNASDRHDQPEVARLLSEAIAKVPEFAGYFQFQLGRHFSQTGRPFEALAAFDRAEQLDPKMAPLAEPYRGSIREHTPGCLIGR